MADNAPVLVRNREPGPTVFTDVKTNTSIEWQGAGHPDGEDIQQVPAELVTGNVNFMKAIQRGIFVVEEATPEIMESVAHQSQAWRARQETSAAQAKAALDQVAQDDLLMVECVGPSPRGAGTCRQPVAVRVQTQDEKPPLCDRHKALSSQYVMSEKNELRDGKPVREWVRTQVGTPLG